MISILIIIIFFIICFVLLHDMQLGFALVIAIDLFFVRAVSFMGILPLRELFMVVTWFFFLNHGIIKKEYEITFKGVYKKPFIIFFIGILLIFLFSTKEANISTQLKHIFGLIYYFGYAFIAWVIYDDQKSIILFTRIMIISVLVMTLYGFWGYLTTSNPYLSALEKETGTVIIGGLDENRGGLTGRTQSTMSHPLTWAGCCGLFLLFFLRNDIKLRNKLKYFLLISLFINMFLTGSRSALIALLCCFLFLFILKKKSLKIVIISLTVAVILISSLYFIPQFHRYKGLFESTVFFWNEDVSNEVEIQGSSVSMRTLQLYGSLEMIADNPVFGLGLGYVDYYCSNFGQHPVLMGFESIIFNKLIESGFFGLLLWIYFFVVLFFSVDKLNKHFIKKQDVSIIKAYVLYYFIFSLFTGFMQTFLCFFVLYMIMVKGLYIKNEQYLYNYNSTRQNNSNIINK